MDDTAPLVLFCFFLAIAFGGCLGAIVAYLGINSRRISAMEERMALEIMNHEEEIERMKTLIRTYGIIPSNPRTQNQSAPEIQYPPKRRPGRPVGSGIKKTEKTPSEV